MRSYVQESKVPFPLWGMGGGRILLICMILELEDAHYILTDRSDLIYINPPSGFTNMSFILSFQTLLADAPGGERQLLPGRLALLNTSHLPR